MRTLVARLQKLADKESDEYARRHWLRLVESLARQMKDAPLFGRTRIASWGSLTTAACLDIARVYLESGDAQTALMWLRKSPTTESHNAGERDELLLEVHGRLGSRTEQADVPWRMFRRCRSLDSLGRLLAVIGGDRKDEVLAGVARFDSAPGADQNLFPRGPLSAQALQACCINRRLAFDGIPRCLYASTAVAARP